MTDEDTLIDYDNEMESLFGDIQSCLKQLKPAKGKSKLTDAERSAKISHVDGRIKRCKQVLRSYKVDLRSLDKSIANPYEVKANNYKDTINQLIQDLNWVQENELLGDKPGKKNVDSMTADEVLDQAKKTQEKSLTSLDDTLRTIEETKAVGSETSNKLKSQTEQLRKVESGIQEVQSNLKLASKQLSAFARKLATDKLIMGFIVLIIIGIIFIIVWSATHKKKSGPVETYISPNATF